MRCQYVSVSKVKPELTPSVEQRKTTWYIDSSHKARSQHFSLIRILSGYNLSSHECCEHKGVSGKAVSLLVPDEDSSGISTVCSTAVSIVFEGWSVLALPDFALVGASSCTGSGSGVVPLAES